MRFLLRRFSSTWIEVDIITVADGADTARRRARAQPQRPQEWRHRGRDLGGSEGSREEARDRHPDLHGREEPIGACRQPLDRGSALALARHLVDLRGTQRNQSHFGGGEHSTDQNEEKNKEEIERIHIRFLVEGR